LSRFDSSLIGKRTNPTVFEYTWRDVVLYALSVGAQADELQFIYEAFPQGLKVIPSFCVIPAMKAFLDLGKDIDKSRTLHAEQTIRLSRLIPPEGKIIQVAEVSNIFDKGKFAVYVIKVIGYTEDGDPLYETEWVIFHLGEGNFGGRRGPTSEQVQPPQGVCADFSVSYQVPESQAALYRLNGDYNFLHIDPEVAMRNGLERPILQGLCTFGYATRALVKGACGGDVARLKSFKARFTRHVYPGSILKTEGWKHGDRCIIQVSTNHEVVIGNSYAEIAG
jgi:acyl dehydratase